MFPMTGRLKRECAWAVIKAKEGYHDAKTGANSIKLETTGESTPYLDELFID